MRRTPAKKGRREEGTGGEGGGGGGWGAGVTEREQGETERERGTGGDKPTTELKFGVTKGVGVERECMAGWSRSKGYSRGLGGSGIGKEGGGTEQINVSLRRGGGGVRGGGR
jgi:hypothetical protein